MKVGISSPESTYRPFGVFRLFLALMVVVSHTNLLAAESFSNWIGPFGIGNMAVMVFFVLSGFVIAEANDLFYHGRANAFLINRFLRIFPPYWIAVAFSILALLAVQAFGPLQFYDNVPNPEKIFSWQNIIKNFLYPLYLYSAKWFGLEMDFAFVRYIWAVVIELHFYYVAALMYFVWSLLLRFTANGNPLRRLFWPGCFLVFALGFWISHFRQNAVFWYFSFGAYFALGMTLYYFLRSKGTRWLCGLGIFISWVFANCHFFSYVARAKDAPVLACVAIFNILLVIMWILARANVAARFKSWDKALGDLSYPVYLNHYAVSIVFLTLFGSHRDPLLIFLLCAAVCVGISWALNQISEPITRRLRDRIRGLTLN